MNSEQLSEAMFNAGVRLETLFWIPGICADPPREFEDFVTDELADDYAPEVLEALPFLKGMIEEGATAEDVLPEMSFRRKLGFIAQLATPVPRDVRPDGSHSFSWGHTYTKWVYAGDLEALVTRATEWAESVLEQAKAKAAA